VLGAAVAVIVTGYGFAVIEPPGRYGLHFVWKISRGAGAWHVYAGIRL
jgi:hypothetical protein